jgi:hypothetical protein
MAKIGRFAGTRRVHFGTGGHSRARAASRDTTWGVPDRIDRDRRVGKFLQSAFLRCPRWHDADSLLRYEGVITPGCGAPVRRALTGAAVPATIPVVDGRRVAARKALVDAAHRPDEDVADLLRELEAAPEWGAEGDNLEDIVRRAQAGDQQAREELIERLLRQLDRARLSH